MCKWLVKMFKETNKKIGVFIRVFIDTSSYLDLSAMWPR